MIENRTFNEKVHIPHFPTFMVIVASVLTCLSLVWFGVYGVRSTEKLKQKISMSLYALDLRGMILKLDELLTMTAKMYVFTGDPAWLHRYDYYDLVIDELVKKAGLIIQHPDAKKTTQMLEDANVKLGKMERQAFKMAQQGDLNSAKKILLSPEYETQKEIYSNSLENYGEYLKEQARSQIDNQFKQIFYASLVLSLGFIFSLIAWVLAFRSIRKWKALLTNTMINELQYKQDLEESSRFLEKRVKERTDELEVLNKSLQSNEANLTQINKALKESEERFHLAIESTPVGMAITTLDGKFVDINQALCNLFGYSREEMLSMHVRDITYPEDMNKELGDIQKLTENKIRNFQVDKRFVHKNGQVFWALLNASLLRGQTGKPPQLICQVQDITGRKQYEKEIIQLNEGMSTALNELKQHDYEMGLLNKMNEMLQSCQSSAEAYSIIDLSAREIFSGKNLSGGLAIFNEETKNMEMIGKGGANPNLKNVFTFDECWGLRMGHTYVVENPQKSLICKHFESTPLGGYICIPLIVRNRIIGLLSQNATEGACVTKNQQQLFTAFSDVIKLSLANIKLRENLQEQSIRDALTGLYNRRYLEETLPRELQRIDRENKILGVAMIDLDDFKVFNDTYGHEAGDEVLKQLGRLLEKNFRSSDIVCRFGGEEFVIILLENHFDEALARIKKFQEEVKKTEIFFQDKPLPMVTLSIGMAQAPMQGTTAEEIIRAADIALYVAKKEGKDRVEVFSGIS